MRQQVLSLELLFPNINKLINKHFSPRIYALSVHFSSVQSTLCSFQSVGNDGMPISIQVYSMNIAPTGVVLH